MLNALRAALLALCVFMWLPGQAYGQGPQCAPRDAILQSLAKNYKEAPVNMGVVSTGALLEVLVSLSGSWTIIVTMPGGATCLVSSGEGWRTVPVKDEGPAV
ncbi:hypothetical protein HBA54_04115 [Pelagibius litoralis]|uniref:Uncharacterized protein n=1 Tax=Pelagibius litoralis TaxID=374515 RepID=A0A967C721_9PROT|nr:hypothetical protein [Pelagibius litoralis]NIA67767.1 hypothetical protein [Pelagibius litoralis]